MHEAGTLPCFIKFIIQIGQAARTALLPPIVSVLYPLHRSDGPIHQRRKRAGRFRCHVISRTIRREDIRLRRAVRLCVIHGLRPSISLLLLLLLLIKLGTQFLNLSLLFGLFPTGSVQLFLQRTDVFDS